MSKKIQNLYLELSNAVADLEDPPMCSQPVYRDWFFPEGFIPQNGVSTAYLLGQQEVVQLAAVRICQACPVMKLCAQYAIEADETFGIWGGTTPPSRRAISSSASRHESKVA